MVKPGARAPGIFSGPDGTIVVRVRERAVEGHATEAARNALARALGLPKASVALVRGARSRVKTFAVDGFASGRAVAHAINAALDLQRSSEGELDAGMQLLDSVGDERRGKRAGR